MSIDNLQQSQSNFAFKGPTGPPLVSNISYVDGSNAFISELKQILKSYGSLTAQKVDEEKSCFRSGKKSNAHDTALRLATVY